MIMQFGLFGICDGHGGAAAAVSASKLVFYFSYRQFYFGTTKKSFGQFFPDVFSRL